MKKTLTNGSGSRDRHEQRRLPQRATSGWRNFQPPTHFIVDDVYKPLRGRSLRGDETEMSPSVFSWAVSWDRGRRSNTTAPSMALQTLVFGLPGYTASAFPKTLLAELPGVITPETGTERMLAKHRHAVRRVPTRGTARQSGTMRPAFSSWRTSPCAASRIFAA